MTLVARQLRQVHRGAAGPLEVYAGVDLSIEPGQLHVVRGVSGAGKSTLLLALGGMRRPSSGAVTWEGVDVHSPSFDRGKAGFVFQTLELLPYLTARENARLGRGGATRDRWARADRWLEQLGLTERMAHRPAALSQGERQRVALARALAPQPGYLLADEPTGNLDDANARLVFEALRTYCDEGGVAVVATHAAEGRVPADVVWTLVDGTLTGDSSPHASASR